MLTIQIRNNVRMIIVSILKSYSVGVSANDIPNVFLINETVTISPTIEECYVGDVHLEMISNTGQGTINAPPPSKNAFSLT
jgi:hypothetical protein